MRVLALFLSLVVAVLGGPASPPRGPYPRVPAYDACATVAAHVRSAVAASPTVMTDYPIVPAPISYDCLYTIPFNATAGLELLYSLKPYLEWQSTLSYLKNPPPGYWREPWDLVGRLQDMIDHISEYTYEYDFERELFVRFVLAYDGHLRYFPKLLTGILSFGRPIALVSVSDDGFNKTRLYSFDDIVKAFASKSDLPAYLVGVDGNDAQEAIDDYAAWSASNDQDAAYNTVFFNLAQGALDYKGTGAGLFAGGGRGQANLPGDVTMLQWSNGTTTGVPNYARVFVDFDNITTGQDIYDRYIAVSSPISTGISGTISEAAEAEDRPGHSEPNVAPPEDIEGPPGYPKPIKSIAGNYMGGYYLSGQGYEDAAVLSLPSFGGSYIQSAMQTTITNFIKQAKADGKVRLIIDLSANGGGQIPLAYSVFKSLFPDIEPYGATRFRATEDFDLIGQTVAHAVGSNYPWNRDRPPGPGYLLNTYLDTPFITQSGLDNEGRQFGSWAEKYGPHEFHGDNFTSLMRWNLSDPIERAGPLFMPNGYGNLTQVFPERPFRAEDIIILTDGYCASSCALFVEFMTKQAKVKTVAIGGQPGGNGAIGTMQAVGGVRGANVYSFSLIAELAASASYLNPDPQNQALQALAGKYRDTPMLRSAEFDGTVNVRDNVGMDDETQTPLQFVYQAADCRLFYEPQHTVSIESMWKTVYEVAWYGAPCVVGSAYSPSQSSTASSAERRRERRRANAKVTLSQSEADKLRNRWENVVTDLRRIKNMDGFQLP